jgi:hypothetical protein
MIAPKWLNTRCQPIAIPDVLDYYQDHCSIHLPIIKIDIGPDILTYRDVARLCRSKKLKKMDLTVPVMTPKLSSYWLYFITSTSYKLACALVSSMRVEVVKKLESITY